MESPEKIKGDIYKDPLRIYFLMIDDIEKAKNYVYLETYRIENDPIGIKFRNILTKKAEEGVKVILLVDDWGTSVSSKFFSKLIAAGGQVKYFKKLRLSINFFSANHERSHRKLLLIDDKISYVSSINVTNYNLNWRELSLRMEGDIAITLKQLFVENFRLKNTYKFDKRKHTKTVWHNDFEIIRDVPSVMIQRIRKKFLQLINHAKKEIIIETPYFLPTRVLREALMKAAERGVDTKIIIPQRSDVQIINILSKHYLGKLYEAGVKFFYYQPTNLHSKMGIFDDVFYIGSSNFDYRSFRYQFEVGLFGKNTEIYQKIRIYNNQTFEDCIPFDPEEWKNRRLFNKFVEYLARPFRHFL